MKTDSRFSHWSDYWRSGFFTSLPQDFRANYDGEVAEFWQGRFTSLEAGAAVLDVCTGNGAVALLAAAWSRDQELDLSITAVDAARIDARALTARYPSTAELLPRIRFIGGQQVEALDLPAESFDLVTSQFGIEYSRWDEASKVVGRLLKPGGRLAMVTHESTSDILIYMEKEAEEYRQVKATGFHRTIKDFVKGDIRYGEMKSRMRRSLDSLTADLQGPPSPFMRSILNGINGLLNMSRPDLRGRMEALAGFQRQTELGQARLEDMLRVNRAIHDEPEWYRAFETGSLHLVDQGDLYYQGKHHAGRYYCFEKQAAGTGEPADG